jgi:hypothetical protein
VEAPAIEKARKLFDPKTNKNLYNAFNKIVPLKCKFLSDVKAAAYFST